MRKVVGAGASRLAWCNAKIEVYTTSRKKQQVSVSRWNIDKPKDQPLNNCLGCIPVKDFRT
jgi:hypothetical protein